MSSTSPANTFPNRRKEKEIIFATSAMPSSIPKKKARGLLKEINLLKCLENPIAAIPNILVILTEITANARVVFRSLAGARRKGRKW